VSATRRIDVARAVGYTRRTLGEWERVVDSLYADRDRCGLVRDPNWAVMMVASTVVVDVAPALAEEIPTLTVEGSSTAADVEPVDVATVCARLGHNPSHVRLVLDLTGLHTAAFVTSFRPRARWSS